MFTNLESRLNRLRRASHLDDAQISKFASLEKPGTEKQFLAFCVAYFEAVGKCKIAEAKILPHAGFTFEGTVTVNLGRAAGKQEAPIEIGLLYDGGLTFEWGVSISGKQRYEGKKTLKSPFDLWLVAQEIASPLMMGKF